MRRPCDTPRQLTLNPDNYEPHAPRYNRLICIEQFFLNM